MLKTCALCLALTAGAAFAQTNQTAPVSPAPVGATPPATTPVVAAKLTAGSRIFIEPMEGFETSLAAAFIKKKTPVSVVDDKANADFIITGSNAYHPAGWAKTLFVSPNAHASASISVKDAKTGIMVYA